MRNLPFDISEQDLRAIFLPYGPIHSIHIPLKDQEPKEEGSSSQARPKAKGYAFVWMLSKKDAEKALEGANGKKVRAGLADGLVRHKQLKKKLRREEAKLKQLEKERKARVKNESKEEGEGEDAEEKDESGSEEEEEDHNERVIAVDWALSKDKWEEAKAKLEDNDEPPQEDAAESEEEKSDDEDDEVDSDESDSHIGLHDGSDDSDSDEDEDEMNVDEEDVKPGKPQLPQTDTGSTLFVRNVPFEATEDELRTM